MMGLPGMVVSPFSCGMRMTLKVLEGDRVYGLVDGEHAYVVDMVAGAVYQTPLDEILKSFGQYMDESVRVTPMPEKNHYDGKYELQMNQHKADAARARKDIPVNVSPYAIGLISTLTAGRVSAQDLVKGLQARGIALPCKVRNNYAGGWDFYLNDGKVPDDMLTVEDVIRSCFPQRA